MNTPQSLASLPLGPELWTLLKAVHDYLDVLELAKVLGRDVGTKTPVEIIADVIADADAIFPEPKSKAVAVATLQALAYVAGLFPSHPVPAPAPPPAPMPTI
jgi:hypothetical protein